MAEDTERHDTERHDDTDTAAPEQRGGDQDLHVDEENLVDRDSIDFDPDDGLYSGTAVDGTSDIPGPHEEGDDADPSKAATGDTPEGDDDADPSAGTAEHDDPQPDGE